MYIRGMNNANNTEACDCNDCMDRRIADRRRLDSRVRMLRYEMSRFAPGEGARFLHTRYVAARDEIARLMGAPVSLAHSQS